MMKQSAALFIYIYDCFNQFLS